MPGNAASVLIEAGMTLPEARGAVQAFLGQQAGEANTSVQMSAETLYAVMRHQAHVQGTFARC